MRDVRHSEKCAQLGPYLAALGKNAFGEGGSWSDSIDELYGIKAFTCHSQLVKLNYLFHLGPQQFDLGSQGLRPFFAMTSISNT